MYLDYADYLYEDLDRLIEGIDYVLNPDIVKVRYDNVVHSKPDEKLPPQPYIEYLNIDTIVRKLDIRRIESFVLFDEILSLLPHEELNNLRHNRLELYKYIDEYLDFMKGIKLRVDDIHAEDDIKRDIILISPSNKQFSIVRGNWANWVWREKDYKGRDTPDEYYWLCDVINLATAIKSEGGNPIIVADKDLMNKYSDLLSKFKVIWIDIPKGLAKIGYPRDQSVTWFKWPIIGNMALDIRRGEEVVINSVYCKIGLKPLARARWVLDKDKLLMCKFEGGNFFIIKTEYGTALITGIGVRGSNHATFKFLSEILPEDIELYGLPLSGYIRDWANTGAVHLDVTLLYLGCLNGCYVAFVDPLRTGFYSLLRYDREKDCFKVTHFGLFAKKYGIKLDEPVRKGLLSQLSQLLATLN